MNAYARLRALLPGKPLWVGEVLSHNDDGTSTIELPGGVTIRAQGQIVAIGDRAFVEGSRVTGEAPDLPFFSTAV